MAITLAASLTGFLFCAAFHSWIDDKARLLGAKLKRLLTPPAREQPHRIQLLSQLISSLRSGMSLDGGIESAMRNSATPIELRTYLKKILLSKPDSDFLASFLSDALSTGTPVLGTLQIFQKILQVERRVKLKAHALTSQSRAQAEVLSWLPWVMAAVLALMDWEWFSSAGGNSASWLVWSIALLLLAGGRYWIKLLLEKALNPKSRMEELDEKFLPELTLRLIAGISLGLDAESALERSLIALKAGGFDREFKSQVSGNSAVLLSIVSHSARTGAPLREDLTNFLSDLHLQIESRWEERVQRLPVVLMAPLFLCFFPSCLLVLAAILLPLLNEAL